MLVVEDDPDLRATIVELLEREGYAVRSAPHGQAALEQVRDGLDPSLILLDLMMPVMNGWEFREVQRRDPAIAGIPVVVLTAHRDVGTLVEELGVAAGMDKPVHLASLLAVVERYARPRSPSA